MKNSFYNLKQLEELRWLFALSRFHGLVDAFSSGGMWGGELTTIRNKNNKEFLQKFAKVFARHSGMSIRDLDLHNEDINGRIKELLIDIIPQFRDSIKLLNVNHRDVRIVYESGESISVLNQPTHDMPLGSQQQKLFRSNKTEHQIQLFQTKDTDALYQKYMLLQKEIANIFQTKPEMVRNMDDTLIFAICVNKFVFAKDMMRVSREVTDFHTMLREDINGRIQEFNQKYNGYSLVNFTNTRWTEGVKSILDERLAKDKDTNKSTKLYSWLLTNQSAIMRECAKEIQSKLSKEINKILADKIEATYNTHSKSPYYSIIEEMGQIDMPAHYARYIPIDSDGNPINLNQF